MEKDAMKLQTTLQIDTGRLVLEVLENLMFECLRTPTFDQALALLADPKTAPASVMEIFNIASRQCREQFGIPHKAMAEAPRVQ